MLVVGSSCFSSPLSDAAVEKRSSGEPTTTSFSPGPMYVLWAVGEEDRYVELISYDLNNGDSVASSGTENSTISVSYINIDIEKLFNAASIHLILNCISVSRALSII